MAAQAKKGPAVAGSVRAKQITSVVIETFSGALGTTEAAERLGVSLSRYYQLEAKALQGMLQALEPRPRGKAKTPAKEIQGLKAEKRALETELRRHQALLRAAHRTVGLPAKKKGRASSGRRGGRKHRSRGRTVLETLRPEPLVESLDRSPLARERTKVILLTLAGDWSVQQGCARLGICRTRFQVLRSRMLDGGSAAVEERPVGRPARKALAIPEVEMGLRAEVDALRAELKRTRVELELARSGIGKAVERRLLAKAVQR